MKHHSKTIISLSFVTIFLLTLPLLGLAASPKQGPVIANLPDQHLAVNETLTHTIDLWAYATDAEDTPDVMTYTIASSSVMSLGVSIEANRYINLAPATDWTGNGQVMVQVQDTEGLTATDSFRVQVGSKVYLPLVMKPKPGFESYFENSTDGWQGHNGDWTLWAGYYFTTGEPATYVSASYPKVYSNFDYQVRMRRSGCSNCGNAMFVRGNPDPLISFGQWYSSYNFAYTTGGSFIITKRTAGNGTETILQPWTNSPAINTGFAWNTLRVVADGTSISFYINGNMVWSATDTSLTSGRVGLGMFRDSTSAGNQLHVDWATLEVIEAAPKTNVPLIYQPTLSPATQFYLSANDAETLMSR